MERRRQYSTEHALVVAIAAPHDIGQLPEGTTSMKTLSVVDPNCGAWGEQEEHIKPPPLKFHMYSIVDGLDEDAKERVASFILHAVKRHQDQNEMTHLFTHDLIQSPHFREEYRLTVHTAAADEQAEKRTIYVASSERDWGELAERFVDVSATTKVPRRLCDATVLLDCGLPIPHTVDSKAVILIGGESGSGKTWAMITGRSELCDLVVYVRLFSVVMTSMGREFQNITKFSDSKSFASVAAQAVEVAVNNVCSPLLERLRSANGHRALNVRVCFDEMGRDPNFARACYSMGPTMLHEALGFGTAVKLQIFAAGAGVGTMSNADYSSGNAFFKLAILGSRGHQQQRGDRCLYYWAVRKTINWGLEYEPLTVAIHNLAHNWDNLGKRAALLRARDDALREVTSAANISADAKLFYIKEQLLSAVESDAACAAALSNPRVAALILARCTTLARQMADEEVSVRTNGSSDIRRQVLQPVAAWFKKQNIIEGFPVEDPCQLLVECLRHVIFDNYHSFGCFHVTKLVVSRGVLVDNVVFEKVVPTGFTPLLDHYKSPIMIHRRAEEQNTTSSVGGSGDSASSSSYAKARGSVRVAHTACFPENVGRYSISPAMVVMLSNFTSSAFEKNVADISKTFERAVGTFLYLAVQVFRGRPVCELLDFIIGPLAIVGEEAQKTLSSNKVVAYDSLELRVSGPSEASHVISALTKERHREALSPCESKAFEHASKLWTVKTTDGKRHAWIEHCPKDFPCADVVLHIPDVITLPIRCKDSDKNYTANDIREALKPMIIMEPWKSTMCHPDTFFVAKLHALGSPVVPMLLLSRAATLSASTVSWEKCEAVDARCIVAEGFAEPALPEQMKLDSEVSDNEVAARCSITANDQRLHQIRRSMMVLSTKRDKFDDVVCVVTAPPAVMPHRNGAKYISGSRVKFTEGVTDAPERESNVATHEGTVRLLSENDNIPNR
ncbi:Hypothetical protein, putative [Bodo saltans]|uniref:Uncharacterized protein n=1 Tax=Bodo saltans TaxID=75058 RepID=A0A0S4JFX5_BODSA|nr:Hypothetical protein, putative [Bodo saltans]|eukprot:CUG89178.1 Hypothetical protein, putative [Bodo saltans]